MEEVDCGGRGGDAKEGAIGLRRKALTSVEQERVKALQRLANAPDRRTYLALQAEIAQQLKMSVRNVPIGLEIGVVGE